MNRALQAELREIASEADCFNNAPGGREVQGSVAEDVRRSVLDGARKFQEDSAKAGAKTQGKRLYSSLAFNKPLESIAAGCHSGQVREFNEMYRSHGITGAYHKPDGTCVFETNNSRNAVLAVRGLYDRDAGYRQYTGIAKDD